MAFHPLQRFTDLGVTFTVTSLLDPRLTFVPSQDYAGNAKPGDTLALETALMARDGQIEGEEIFQHAPVRISFVADDPVCGQWTRECEDTGFAPLVFSLN